METRIDFLGFVTTLSQMRFIISDMMFFTGAIFIPIFLHLRKYTPATMFFITGVIYACIGLLRFFSDVVIAVFGFSYGGPWYERLYWYLYINGFDTLFPMGLMTSLAAIFWLQKRLNAMYYPKLIKSLFWLLHFSLLINWNPFYLFLLNDSIWGYDPITILEWVFSVVVIVDATLLGVVVFCLVLRVCFKLKIHP